MNEVILKVGVTPEHQCGYLPEQKEQLLVLLDQSLFSAQGYEHLLSMGFRRSGSDIYKPQCKLCSACRSIRVLCQDFSLSKSQKRLLNKNKDIILKPVPTDKPEYFQLYQQYIGARHQQGTMYPPSKRQYQNFLNCTWLKPWFFEFWLDSTLVGVAVTDILPNSMSAMYTFYDPAYKHRSLGTYAILKQLQFAKANAKSFLYLGYQVNNCQKMSYKKNFHPFEIFVSGKWNPSLQQSLYK